MHLKVIIEDSKEKFEKKVSEFFASEEMFYLIKINSQRNVYYARRERTFGVVDVSLDDYLTETFTAFITYERR